MTHYTSLELKHANLNRPVFILLGTIAGYHWSDASKSTHVYTTGGVFPVAESPEEVRNKINKLSHKEGNNGE